MPLLPYDSTRLCGNVPDAVAPDIRPSQLNNNITRSLMRPYGRPLRGVGEVPSTPYFNDSWAGQDSAVDEANMDDDSVGNGIFDGLGAPPIQHAGTGVFQAHYAEPGYLYREQMNEPGPIVDAVTGAPMVYRPAGGGWQADMTKAYNPYDAEVPRLYGTSGVEDGQPASLAQWAIGGLIVGVAAAIVVGTLNARK